MTIALLKPSMACSFVCEHQHLTITKGDAIAATLSGTCKNHHTPFYTKSLTLRTVLAIREFQTSIKDS